jgi:hypothetical protein
MSGGARRSDARRDIPWPCETESRANARTLRYANDCEPAVRRARIRPVSAWRGRRHVFAHEPDGRAEVDAGVNGACDTAFDTDIDVDADADMDVDVDVA